MPFLRIFFHRETFNLRTMDHLKNLKFGRRWKQIQWFWKWHCLLWNKVKITIILACLAALRGCLLWETFWLISPRTALPLRDWRAPLFLPDAAGRACKFSCHTTLDLDELNKNKDQWIVSYVIHQEKAVLGEYSKKIDFPNQLIDLLSIRVLSNSTRWV